MIFSLGPAIRAVELPEATWSFYRFDDETIYAGAPRQSPRRLRVVGHIIEIDVLRHLPMGSTISYFAGC